MKIILNMIIGTILIMSLALNLFLRSNNEVKCSNIDSRAKANILYIMGHRGLDWNKNGIPCENLGYNE